MTIPQMEVDWGNRMHTHKAVVECNDHPIMVLSRDFELHLKNTDDHFIQLQPYTYKSLSQSSSH
jgi:hypothetical protein